MRRSRWVAGALLVGTFTLGALVGGAASLFADRHHGDRRDQFSPTEYAGRLARDLRLSERQRDSVTSILERHRPAMDSIWSVVRPQFETERQSIRQEIKGLLNPDQSIQYQQLLARKDSVHRARLRHGSL